MIPGGNETRHRPVMVDEVVGLLVTDPNGVYIDLTLGAGGHAKELASNLGKTARLYGIDKDPEAIDLAGSNLRDCPQLVKTVKASYGQLAAVADLIGETAFDGILLDLGLSSIQLDDAGRGFSFRLEGHLDMRFDAMSGDRSAADLVNALSAEELTEIIRDFGEERQAARVAAAIVRERQTGMIRTTSQLARIVSGVIPPPHRTKSLARVFQALRIAVNRELDTLTRTLPVALEHLRAGGRLAVISYHSLEDRIVKRFLQREAKGCTCPPHLPVCVCNKVPQLRILTRKPVVPDDSEIRENPRSRSARLRVAERPVQ